MNPSQALSFADRVILEERARRVAMPLDAERNAETIEVLTFSLAHERFAVESQLVHRIATLSVVTRVPVVSDLFLGVVNVHGEILPVVDLQRLLGMAVQPANDAGSCALVLGRERPELVLAADAADEIRDVELPPLDHSPSPLVRFVTPDAVTVLAGEALLADPRLASSIPLIPANSSGEST